MYEYEFADEYPCVTIEVPTELMDSIAVNGVNIENSMEY